MPEDALAEVKRLIEAGELLDAIDHARAAAAGAEGTDEAIRLQIEEIVLLARIASLGEAQEKFAEYGLEAADEGRARSLWARLRKDLGFEAENPEERVRLLRESRALYQAVAADCDPETGEAQREQFEYNAINAVTLSYLLGEPDAPGVRRLAERLRAGKPLDSYYSWATRAELLLVTEPDSPEIREALERAVGIGGDLSARATTMRQLLRIAPAHPALDALKPGPVLHYAGHIIAHPDAAEGRVLADREDDLRRRIAAKLDDIRPSMVIGSIAAGADILVLEQALARGVRARVGLPFDLEDFIESSVRPSGEGWVERAHRILASDLCACFHLSTAKRVPEDNRAFGLVSRHAMGSAVLYAQRIHSDVEQLLVWDGIETCGAEGAAADRRVWIASGRTPIVIDVSDCGAGDARFRPARESALDRGPCAIVFGDVKNFSKLAEAQLPAFVDHVLGAVGDALKDVTARYGHRAVSFRNTWGDGVFAVFPQAAPAAWFALRLQARMSALPLEELGLPPDLSIRLGLHYGQAHERIDPVTGLRNFFGEAVAKAARIEPIVKAGRVFASEEFASELALDPDSGFVTEYVGERDTHKDFGRFRLYRLKDDPRAPAGETEHRVGRP